MNNKIKKTVIIVGYNCNNNCRFCIDSEKRTLRNKTTREIKSEMGKAKDNGTTYIELIGGESTLHPDFLDLVHFARKSGFKEFQIQSNGRLFAYNDFCLKTIRTGAT